jgi:hypothetical protein
LTWSTTDPSVATVSSSGLLTGVGTSAGATSVVGVSYTTPTGTVTASTVVTLALDNPISVAITPAALLVPAGSRTTFTAIGTYPGGRTANISRLVAWTRSNPLAGAFDLNVLTVGGQAGGQSIDVAAVAPNNVTSPTTAVTVALGKPSAVTVTGAPSTLTLGHSQQLTATASYVDGSTGDVTGAVQWTSSNPAAVSVDATGTITALSTALTDSAYISAVLTNPDGTNRSTGTSITTTLRYPTSITVSPDAATVVPGGTQAYTATGSYLGGRTVDLTSQVSWATATSIPDAATGMSSNVLHAAAGGPTGAPVTVVATWGQESDGVSVTLTPAITATGPTALAGTAGVPVSATFSATGGSGHYLWSYSGALSTPTFSSTTGATVTFTGTPTQASTYNGTVTLTDADHPAASSVRIFNVSAGYQPQVITFASPATAAVGTTVALTATGGGSGRPVEFTRDASSDTGVCYLNAGATAVIFYAVGTCVLDANQLGGAGVYAAATQVQASITVRLSQTLGFTTSAPTGVSVGSGPYIASAGDTGAASGTAVALSIDAATTGAGSTDATCSLLGTVVSFDHAGVCVLDADQAANGDYLAATRVQQTIPVAPGGQTLAFGTAPGDARVGGDYSPTLTSGGSGRPTVLTVDTATTNSACALVAGTVDLRHPGTCVLDADQAGTTDYAAAPQAQQTFTVSPGRQTVRFASDPPATSPAGSQVTLAAAATSGLPVTLTADDANGTACVLSGVVLTLGLAGTCTVSADQAGTVDYAAADQVSETFVVAGPTVSITAAASAPTASINATTPVTVSLSDAAGPIAAPVPITVDLAALTADGSPSATATLAATTGGDPISAVTIPAGSSTATVYFGDPVAETVQLGASEQTGVLAPATARVTVQPGKAIPTLRRQPSATLAGAIIQPVVAVRALDALGNPVVGIRLYLLVTPSVHSEGAVATTDASGTAMFSSFSIGTPGTYRLTAATAINTLSAASAPFVIGALPVVTALAPSRGPAAGGETVAITGSGFTGATAVRFDSIPAAKFTVVSDTLITATAPAQSAGEHDVSVTSPSGNSPIVNADAFTAWAAPAVTGLSPSAGPAVGGVLVKITGTDLAAATAVTFGSLPAAKFTVAGDGGSITAVSPAKLAGSVPVTVTTPGGTSRVTTADHYTAVLAPVITRVAPASGPAAGGTSVTITGTGFAGATAVKFGTTPATKITVSGTTIVALAPKLTPGLMNVRVTTVGGTSAAVTADHYTAVAK